MLATAVASLIHRTPDAPDPKSRELTLMLLASTAEPFSRSQFFPGHITCTGLVFAPDGERILLVHHRRLDRWLLPGGHVEPEDSEIWEAARREVIEETGAQLAPNGLPPLSGLDVHGIPAGKGEPYHLHHDLLFHFRAVSPDLRLSQESRDIAWCAPADFDRYSVPDNVRVAYFRMRKLSFQT